ncbi:hypothetical protein INT80_14340 [Gallibacterium anatis]|uniref:MukB hinge domain-containing protein n=1 Tax=Gallibacterium anatis TaxID=750 RepID=A0A930YAY1_9PAST|nr:hypothetical protein [Gallibacterium anatis]
MLSELYDDVDISDAPYFLHYMDRRAMRSWWDLEAVKPLLQDLQDCPDDLYLIEGDRMRLMTVFYRHRSANAGVVVQVSGT